ncbi:glycoside hydrolase family 3 N-terminal domain-containing protein [Pontiellaceae bacterium B12227]|nr:glycoside hydrolase family 3 N-terminal domain-containing protein [Pontiellaceae bacterium B12227]
MSEQAKRNEFIDDLLKKMTVEEKVGQCFTFSWRGSIVTPSVKALIEKLHVGGLRIEPYTAESARSTYYGKTLADTDYVKPEGYTDMPKTYFTAKTPGNYIMPSEYAERINELQQIATSTPAGIPLNICTDNEGACTNDYQFGGMPGYPALMGLAATGDLELTKQVGESIGKQLRAVGITMLHSPVCDINVNAANPEIRFRGFSDDPEKVSEFVSAFSEGLIAGGIIPMAKHYPGRGDSSTDAHYELEQIEVDKERLLDVELRPYKRMIEKGCLKGVMTCHSAYPLVVGEDLPATLSKVLVTDILRNELGFDGVITSDAMGMGAIVNRYGLPNACVMALKAGVNLMLCKSDDETREQVYYRMLDAVRSNEVTMDLLEGSVRKVLEAKYDQGLFENAQVDAPAASAAVRSDEILNVAQQSAEKSLTLMRDEECLLPLSQDKKVLIIEQLKMAEFTPNDVYQGHWRLNAEVLKHSDNVINSDCTFIPSDEEVDFLCDLAKNEADVVVVTNFFWRHAGNQANTKLVERLIAEGNKVVVVTNDPYAEGAPATAGTVVNCWSLMGESLKEVAEVLYGKKQATGSMPVSNFQAYAGRTEVAEELVTA